MYLAFTLLNKRHIFYKKIVLSVFLNFSFLVIKFRFLSVPHNDSKWNFAVLVLSKQQFVYILFCNGSLQFSIHFLFRTLTKKDFACFLFH
jgi:hypothetical protein